MPKNNKKRKRVAAHIQKSIDKRRAAAAKRESADGGNANDPSLQFVPTLGAKRRRAGMNNALLVESGSAAFECCLYLEN